MRRRRFHHAIELETVVEVESATDEFPHSVVDERGVVYFDVSKASLDSKAKLMACARPKDRCLHAKGRLYLAAPHLRRHLPPEALERFDVMVSVRREQAAEWAGPNVVKLGMFSRLVRSLTASTNGRSGAWH